MVSYASRRVLRGAASELLSPLRFSAPKQPRPSESRPSREPSRLVYRPSTTHRRPAENGIHLTIRFQWPASRDRSSYASLGPCRQMESLRALGLATSLGDTQRLGLCPQLGDLRDGGRPPPVDASDRP